VPYVAIIPALPAMSTRLLSTRSGGSVEGFINIPSELLDPIHEVELVLKPTMSLAIITVDSCNELCFNGHDWIFAH